VGVEPESKELFSSIFTIGVATSGDVVGDK